MQTDTNINTFEDVSISAPAGDTGGLPESVPGGLGGDVVLSEHEVESPAPRRSAGEIIRDLAEAQSRVDALQAEMSEAKKEVEKYKAEIEEYMDVQGLTSVPTEYGKAVKSTRKKAVVKDWEEFYRWVIANQMPDVLTKSVNTSAVMEVMESGEHIPAVEIMELDSIRFYKSKG